MAMKFILKDFNRNIPDESLLCDLKLIAEKLGVDRISTRQYNDNGGKYNASTISARFGSWNNALEKIGLNFVQKNDASDEELFLNLEKVWIVLGKQRVFRDMKRPLSNFSADPYKRRFGTFRNALIAFVEFINTDKETNDEISEFDENDTEVKKEIMFKHKTKRNPSERLKVQVLMRDGNKCRLCGITLTGDNIHFDHIKPWSKGGETTLENLQILCEKHNLAKGNLDYEPQ
jgi:predicted HNH restriction endonuclease